MTKIASIVGARPQFVKAAPLNEKLLSGGLEMILVHTGQHYDANMSAVFFEELALPAPKYHLGVGSGSHGEQTGRMLTGIEDVLFRERPQLVIVYGDTNSTLAGALAAAKLDIPVAHLEAGLRSYKRSMPEETNRVLTDHVSSLLFCPTVGAVRNLEREGFDNIANHGNLVNPSEVRFSKGSPPVVVNVGDIMFESVLRHRKAMCDEEVLGKFHLNPEEYVLATVHRAENTDVMENLSAIWKALNELAASGLTVVFPAHPRTRKALGVLGCGDSTKSRNLIVTEPVGYGEMLVLEDRSRAIITDSGGVQKEAYFFQKPCIIARPETEWTELLESGRHVLVGVDEKALVTETLRLIDAPRDSEWIDHYGDGNTADKVVTILRAYLDA
jgi:UDP-N-acetylglucosamine 2-epimerase